MKIRRLDHVNIRTTQLDTMITWYENVLNLTLGDRPDFPFHGAWMYAEDAPVVHLVGIDGSEAVGSEVELKLEHFALSASGRIEFEEMLVANNLKYRRSDIPAFNIIQINVWDPDGNHIHVDFPADE